MSGQATKSKYIPVIGLEVHAQLATDSKIFCSDDTGYGAAPNTQVSVISLGHPGVLPKLNKMTVTYAIKMGLACHSEIARTIQFDRKNYFYPDLPKGYQITQDSTPLCKGGHVMITIDDNDLPVPLNRIHLEEDAGKSIHVAEQTDTLLDFNRAGIPLIEIVTEPSMHSSLEAYEFLSEIRKIVRYLGICDGNMEQGSLRCDANVSVMPGGSETLGKKVEIKNMNSMRNVQRAIDFEIERQVACLERGEKIHSHTRLFDAERSATYEMRTKEELNDYRYFIDPDISPVEITSEWLDEISREMPQGPFELKRKFTGTYGLPEYDAGVLTESRETANYFEAACAQTVHFKAVSNWIMGPIRSYLNEVSTPDVDFPLPPASLALLVNMVEEGKVSFSVASQRLFPALVREKGKSPLEMAQQLDVLQESGAEFMHSLVDTVLEENPEKVQEYQKGKKGLLAMFMGEVMKRSHGKADPRVASALLKKKLE